MNNLEAGLFFTSQTVSITCEYSWERIQSEKLCFPSESVFVQAIFPGFAVINAHKVFGVRLFGHNVNKEENETSNGLFGEIIDYLMKIRFLFPEKLEIEELPIFF